jgi:hypothetical protein
MKSNLIINTIEVDNCFIKLSNAESLYLSEEISRLIESSNLNNKTISNTLKIFRKNVNKRYFSYKDINSISNNLLENLKNSSIKEEIGRNYSSNSGVYSSINDSGSISPEGVLNDLGYELSYDDNQDDTEENQNFIYLRNVLTKNIVKNNS